MKIKWFGLLLVAVLGCIVLSEVPATAGDGNAPAVDVAEPVAAPDFELGELVTLECDYTDAEASLYEWYVRDYIPLDPDVQVALFSTCDSVGVDYALALGLIQVESSFIPDAVNSKSGCYGLCQLHPLYFPTDLSPVENVETGIACLGEKIKQYRGDIPAALTAYNAGHDTGNRWYANRVLEAAEEWRGLV